MTLVQQFPDISRKTRSKNENVNKTYRLAGIKRSLAYVEDEAVVRYYEGEFRRWHVKFLLILGGIFGIMYFLLLKSFWIYNLLDIK
jgi:hypothetical protein